MRTALWKDYELVDTAAGERLERWGKVLVIRPDPQAGKRRMPAICAPPPAAAIGRNGASFRLSGRFPMGN